MQMDKLTMKSGEALQQAQRLAGKLKHPEIRPLHLLVSLCEQGEGVVSPVLQRIGAVVRQFIHKLSASSNPQAARTRTAARPAARTRQPAAAQARSCGLPPWWPSTSATRCSQLAVARR